MFKPVTFCSLAFLASGAAFAQLDLASSTPSQQCTDALAPFVPNCEMPSSGAADAPLTPRRKPSDALLSPTLRKASPNPPAAESAATAPAPAPLAPQLPTEFQQFAAASVGQILPIFGASLFENVPTTFAPLDRVPVTADYVLGPGDEVLLRMWGQVNMDLDLTVDRAGAVFIPQAGNVTLAGLQFHQLPTYLKAQLARVFKNFDLNVEMGQLWRARR